LKTAREIMTPDPITVRLTTPIKELAALLCDKKISGLPVLDDDGNLAGVVTESDLIEGSKKLHIPTVLTLLDSMIFLENPARTDREMKKMTATCAGDVMTAKPITIREETLVDEIATIMAEKKVHTLPVVDADGSLIGIVGRDDIIRTLI